MELPPSSRILFGTVQSSHQDLVNSRRQRLVLAVGDSFECPKLSARQITDDTMRADSLERSRRASSLRLSAVCHGQHPFGMPPWLWTSIRRDIKNFQMRDYETRNFGQNLIGLKNHHLLNAQFRDFEELSAAAAEWDLDFVQLDAGPARTSLTQVSTPALLIQRFRFGRTYFQRGASPLGMQTIGLVEPRASDVRMFGGDLTDSDIALFRPGGDFESVSPPNFGCLAISIDETLLEETFESLEFRRGSCNAASEMALIKVAPSILQRLRYSVTRVLDQLEANPDSLAQSELTDEFTFQLAIDLTLAIQLLLGHVIGERVQAIRIQPEQRGKQRAGAHAVVVCPVG